MELYLNKKYWDSIAETLRSHYRSRHISYFYRQEYDELFNEWYPSFENKKILITDVFNEAFEREELPLRLWNQGGCTIGMDISEFVIKKFDKIHLSRKKLVCDIRDLPFKNSSFDMVISPSTLDHFPKKDLAISLREIRRILKKEGTLIMFLHNKFNLFFYFYQLKIRKMLPFPLQLYSKNETKKILTDNKFLISNLTAIVHIPFPLLFERIEFYLRKFNKWKMHNFLISKMHYFHKLRKKKTEFFTGVFIVAKAIKE